VTTINVVSAYGRSYDSIVSAKEDWDLGKDFKIVGGPYINKSDWLKYSKEDTVVYQGDSSIWVLEESKPLDYWDKQEKVEEVVKGFKKVQENA
jgi:hypothetical protein